VETYTFSPSEHGPQKVSFDLFQGGSVQFIHTPGHTTGIASTIIQRNNKFVILFADVGYARKSWEQMIPPGTAVNMKKAISSLEWIKMMSKQLNCIESLASPEASVMPHTVIL
jgi:N-acyl homoserine lactone hydrolase